MRALRTNGALTVCAVSGVMVLIAPVSNTKGLGSPPSIDASMRMWPPSSVKGISIGFDRTVGVSAGAALAARGMLSSRCSEPGGGGRSSGDVALLAGGGANSSDAAGGGG